MKNFIEITDFEIDELLQILDRADELQIAWQTKTMPDSLKNENIALWFLGNGFRNRMAFEIGARAMGADVSFVPGELGIHEPLEDIGAYLDNWFSLLVMRTRSHSDLEFVCNNSDTPIINGRTDFNHPCEIIGDLQYIRKQRGSIEGLEIVFVGEVANLSMSWFEAAVRFPIKVIQVAPKGYELPDKKLNELMENAKGEIKVLNDFENAITSNTDVIYTDCWPRTHKAKELFLPFQITGNTLSKMNQNGFFLPCPPVTRGQEVSFDAMNSHLCKNYEAKEYLLHSQNAIMEFLIKS